MDALRSNLQFDLPSINKHVATITINAVKNVLKLPIIISCAQKEDKIKFCTSSDCLNG